MHADAPIRQGDILLIPTPRIPDNTNPVGRDSAGRIVLAEGEVTGHAHAILDDPVTLFAPGDLDEMADRFLHVEQEVALVHEEHGTLTVPAGDYIVRRKREYEPQAPRFVAD